MADASLAREVREVVGESIPVEVGPTPELEAVLAAMVESLCGNGDDEAASDFEGGRIPAATLEDLFRSAELLYRMAPRKVATDDQVLRMDIPPRRRGGVRLHHREPRRESRRPRLPVPRRLRGLPALRRGAAAGGGADRVRHERALPQLRAGGGASSGLAAPRDRDPPLARGGREGPSDRAAPRSRRRVPTPRGRDLRIASACVSALTAFFVKHESVFRAETFAPVCESYTDDDDLTVRFTIPYEGFPSSTWATPRPGRTSPSKPRVGRNDPCPCGSGRKYKKCHLAAGEARGSAAAGPSPSHDLDDRLVLALTRFASSELGAEWRRFVDDFVDARNVAQLSIPWSVYGYRVRGQTVVDSDLESKPTFSLLAQLFSLQSGKVERVAPILTLPLR